MSPEQQTQNPLSPEETANILAQKEQLLAAWQTLPEEHKATMALALLETVMVGEQRVWLQYAIATKWPLRTEQLATTYPTIELTRLNLMRANLDDEQIAQFTPEHLGLIAQTMRNHYIHDLFWPEFRHLAHIMLDNLDNSQ